MKITAKRRRRTAVEHPICPIHEIKMPTSRVWKNTRYHYCPHPGCHFAAKTQRIEKGKKVAKVQETPL